jgi:hypothetical protein
MAGFLLESSGQRRSHFGEEDVDAGQKSWTNPAAIAQAVFSVARRGGSEVQKPWLKHYPACCDES